MTAPLSSLADHADERFTEAQRAKLAEFDAAPVPPEVVEADRLARVTEALLITVLGTDDGDVLVGYDLPVDEIARLIVEHGAAAAIAALPPSPAEEAVKRVEALAEEFDRPIAGITFGGIPQRALFSGGDVCYRLRATLASPAPAPQGGGA